MELVSAFEPTFEKDLVCGAVDELRYPCCFNTFVEDLEEKENNLITTIKSVEDRSKHATKQGKKTAEVIDKWLEEANLLKDDVEDLLKKARTSKNSNCLWHCPNWLWRYRLGKKLANKKVDVVKCSEEGSKYVLLEDVAGDKYLEFDSRKIAYQNLMEAVKNDNVSRIGLYGMGGCGKTTLALKLINTTKHLFDIVVFVVVSIPTDVRSIQEKIASSLQFQFLESEERERAQRLRTRLIQENKILLILDDVWQFLDFDAIGIPTSTTHKCCKVLITTRSKEVCTLMNCQRKISLSILDDDEAWALFQKQAGLSESTSDTLKDLARQISNECKGLPIALAAVASTLKGKSEVEWNVALDRLRNSKPMNVEKGLQNPYKCLQLSYDNLDTEEAKSLLLLCSVYPKDYEISVEELTRYAIGLGLGGEFHSYEGARNDIRATKNKLISSCLLLAGSNFRGEYVMMEDLVRDVAHWISKEQNKNMMGYYSPRYLRIENFQDEPDFSNLEYLHLWLSTEFEISGEIFKRMGNLRVLLLLNRTMKRTLSTVSLNSLTNLHHLSLSFWRLSEFSFLGDMKKLESLVLHYCSFVELPNEIIQLKNLRLLHLEKCFIEKNYFEVVARLQVLEELYVTYWSAWNDHNENFAEFFQGLKRYVIQGDTFQYCGLEFAPYQKTSLLCYYHTLYAAAKVLAQRAECLVLEKKEGCANNFMPDISLEWRAVNISDSNLFPELGALKIRRARSSHISFHLIALTHGHLPSSSPFQKLEELELINCSELTYLFTSVVARSLVELKSLRIAACHGLKHILVDDDDTDDGNSLVFSKLKEIIVCDCGKIEYIIPITFAQGLLQLNSLHIIRNDNLKYAFGRNTHGAQSQNELDIIELPSLNYLHLEALPQAISIFPENCCPRLPSLRTFHFISCPKFATKSIKTCWKTENWYDHEETKDLELENPPQLIYICMSFNDPSKFEKLEILKIVGCEIVDVIFHARVSRCLTELKTLVIRKCKELKQIVEEDVENAKLSKLPSQQLQPCFPKLALLFVEECHKLKCFISFSRCNDLPNLAVLIINKASELEELIGCEQGNDYEIGEKKVELPKLKYLMFRKLPKLCQGIESHTLRHRVIDNCPKLSLTSTATFQDFEYEVTHDNDFQISGIESWKLSDLFEEAQSTSGDDSPSSQINEESKKEVIEKVASSQEKDPMPKTTSTLGNLVGTVSRDNQIESESTAPESSKFVESKNGKQRDTTLKIVGAEIAPISSPNLTDNIDETKRADIGKDPSLVKPAIPSSGSELREPSPTSLTTPPHNQVDQEPSRKPGVLEEQVSLGEKISMKDTGKERIQKGIASKETSMKTLSAGVEGIGEGSKLMSKEGGIGVVSNDSIEVPPDTHGSHSLIIAKLGAYKHVDVDMNDAQIAVLSEAIAAYPHLWNVCEKFSERFRALMLKTLADMLWFLRNESTFSVTPTREKEFHRLCDEAVQLGFDSSWVEEMRRRVVVKDPKVEQSQARRDELLKRHDQLTQQLHEIKDEINSLDDFLVKQKKCFDFL